MTKRERIMLVRALKAGECPCPDQPEVTDPLVGVGTSNFPKGKSVSFECALMFLRYQCLMMNGKIDEAELSSCLESFKVKGVEIL